MLYKNDFGRFDLKEVIINKSNTILGFNEIAYMKVRHEKNFFFQKKYLHIVFIYAYPIKYNINKNEVDDAKKFANSFSKVRAQNTATP